MSERIHGPYKHHNKWRVIEVRDDGERAVVSFESKADACAYIEAARRTQVGRSVKEAVTEYLQWLKDAPGRGGRARRDSTVALASWRLRAFLRLDTEDMPLGGLTRSVARDLFRRREGEVRVDTLAGELSTVRRAVAWWAGKGWVGADPFVWFEVKGSRSAGKPQLRADEARRYLAVALTEGQPGLAAAMALLMGMRASEITGLVVRDIDDGGRSVWITAAKTKRGIRRLAVPEMLVPHLAALVRHRFPAERLWGDVDRHWLYYHVPRIGDRAGVPRVTPHGLRGTWATLAVGVVDTNAAAAALGHLPSVTHANYAAPGAEQSGQASRVAAELGGHHASDSGDRHHGPGGSGELPRPHHRVPGADDGALPADVGQRAPLWSDGDAVRAERTGGVVDAGDGPDRSPRVASATVTPPDGKFPLDVSDDCTLLN